MEYREGEPYKIGRPIDITRLNMKAHLPNMRDSAISLLAIASSKN